MSAETPREVVTRLAKAPTDPGLTAIAHALLDLADAVREATGKLDGFRTAWCPYSTAPWVATRKASRSKGESKSAGVIPHMLREG